MKQEQKIYKKVKESLWRGTHKKKRKHKKTKASNRSEEHNKKYV